MAGDCRALAGLAGPARLVFLSSPVSGREMLTAAEGFAGIEALPRGAEAGAAMAIPNISERSPVSSRGPV
ncbi:MAG: hypothetical protein WBD65_17245, partial [Methylocella sp.]